MAVTIAGDQSDEHLNMTEDAATISVVVPSLNDIPKPLVQPVDYDSFDKVNAAILNVVTENQTGGSEFLVDIKALRQSKVLVELLHREPEDPIVILPINDIKGNKDVMAFIILYLEYHAKHGEGKEIPRPLPENLVGLVSAWDWGFIKLMEEYKKDESPRLALLADVIIMSNYLNIKSLLDLGCARIGDLMKGKTPDEIRVMFGLPDDLTEEEKKSIEQENSWCEESGNNNTDS